MQLLLYGGVMQQPETMISILFQLVLKDPNLDDAEALRDIRILWDHHVTEFYLREGRRPSMLQTLSIFCSCVEEEAENLEDLLGAQFEKSGATWEGP